ncbi:TetR/AcrR family transcriptional regulator [Flavobacterium mekongense]|uniref:TetR/AcrR family transcriptional regulator n=1 Tax=Flavobacterium mekongense TaxID=3379707 RepID=UPI003999D5C8
MEDQIVAKAIDMFINFGFKNVTMDEIAKEMGISKKTIYKFYENKEILVNESILKIQNNWYEIFDQVLNQGLNAIQENLEIHNRFKSFFKNSDTSLIYQLKKYYPQVYKNLNILESEELSRFLTLNITKGIAEGYYREDVNIKMYNMLFNIVTTAITENYMSEYDVQNLNLWALEHHMRAMSTELGQTELVKQLKIYNLELETL